MKRKEKTTFPTDSSVSPVGHVSFISYVLPVNNGQGGTLSAQTMQEILPALPDTSKQEKASITHNTSSGPTNHIFPTVNTDAHPTIY